MSADDETEPEDSVQEVWRRVSLLDPISLSRIRSPVRGAECDHPEVFDRLVYLEYNKRLEMTPFVMRKRMWKCPHCDKPASSKRLQPVASFEELLEKAKRQPDLQHACVLPSGKFYLEEESMTGFAMEFTMPLSKRVAGVSSPMKRRRLKRLSICQGLEQKVGHATKTIESPESDIDLIVDDLDSSAADMPSRLSSEAWHLNRFAPGIRVEEETVEWRARLTQLLYIDTTAPGGLNACRQVLAQAWAAAPEPAQAQIDRLIAERSFPVPSVWSKVYQLLYPHQKVPTKWTREPIVVDLVIDRYPESRVCKGSSDTQSVESDPPQPVHRSARLQRKRAAC